MNGTDVEVIVDTGASTDILDEATFAKVNHQQNIQLKTPTKARPTRFAVARARRVKISLFSYLIFFLNDKKKIFFFKI